MTPRLFLHLCDARGVPGRSGARGVAGMALLLAARRSVWLTPVAASRWRWPSSGDAQEVWDSSPEVHAPDRLAVVVIDAAVQVAPTEVVKAASEFAAVAQLLAADRVGRFGIEGASNFG